MPIILLLCLAPCLWLTLSRQVWQRWGLLYWPPERGLPSLSTPAMQSANDQVAKWAGFPAAILCEQAFNTLKRVAGSLLDTDCVAALVDNRSEVEDIQGHFQEDNLG